MSPNAITPRVQALEASNNSLKSSLQSIQEATANGTGQWRFHDLDGSDLISDTTGGVAGSWQTWTLSGIPQTATHVQLECWSLQNDPDGGDVLSYLNIRANLGSAILIGCAGRSSGSSDGTGSANQGIYLLGPGSTVQYNASIDFDHWQVRLIGYWGT